MDKKQALTVLIKHTYLFSDEVKKRLLDKVDSLSEEDVESLGRFLALEKKKSIQENKQLISEIDTLLNKLKEEDIEN